MSSRKQLTICSSIVFDNWLYLPPAQLFLIWSVGFLSPHRLAPWVTYCRKMTRHKNILCPPKIQNTHRPASVWRFVTYIFFSFSIFMARVMLICCIECYIITVVRYNVFLKNCANPYDSTVSVKISIINIQSMMVVVDILKWFFSFRIVHSVRRWNGPTTTTTTTVC